MDSPSEPLEGAQPANTWILDYEREVSTVLSHQVCGVLLQQPQETNTATKSKLSIIPILA